MTWATWGRPCERCGKRTSSAAARAAEPTPSSGWVVWEDALAIRWNVMEICDECWGRHSEIAELDVPERADLAAGIVAEWLSEAPPARSAARGRNDFSVDLPIAEAGRLCTAAALFITSDGIGKHAWRPGDWRFRFRRADQPARAGDYDDVLAQTGVVGGRGRCDFQGTVRRYAEGIRISWRLQRDRNPRG